MIIVGVAMHDEQVKGGKMTKLTSFIARPCPMRRSSSVARRLLLYARRPCSTFPLAIVVVVVVAVVDERKDGVYFGPRRQIAVPRAGSSSEGGGVEGRLSSIRANGPAAVR